MYCTGHVYALVLRTLSLLLVQHLLFLRTVLECIHGLIAAVCVCGP